MFIIFFMGFDLLVIDSQNDFCSKDGTLYVPNAEHDCQRIADFILHNLDKIDAIHMTLDTHPFFHIAHPIFWKDKNNAEPPVYTQITYEDFKNGIYTPVDKNLYQRVESYLLNLESRGRYTLTIWPPHCLFATPGACINEDIRAAAHTWEKEVPGRSINFVVKAANPLTEHYSAIQAEVPDPADPTTKTNFTLIEKLKHKHIAVVGEALSHCVSNTIRDLCIYIPPEQITLVTDCTSNVAGFEYIGKEFLETYTARGMNTIVSTDPVQ